MTFNGRVFELLAIVFNALVISWAVRRLLGAPVGWPRTLLISGVVGAYGNRVLDEVIRRLDIAPSLASVDATDYAGAALVIALATAWLLALELAALTILEVLFPTGSIPGPWAMARGWPDRVRRWQRYQQIAMIVMRHGLAGFFRSGARGTEFYDRASVARRVREALTDGGVTFIKLGQTLAARADLLPADVTSELSALHSDVPAEPWTVVEPLLRAELGRPPLEIFSSIDPVPVAAASLGQVHFAILQTGDRVAVKVQRPAAAAQIRADLDIIRRLAVRLERRTAWACNVGLRALANGFATALLEELDYRVEATNMAVIAQRSTHLTVPRVWLELSGPRVIVMERVDGTPLSRAGAQIAQLDPQVRRRLSTDLIHGVLRQVTRDGVFHADLHPGNIVLTDGPQVRLALLDFGSVGRLDRTSREAISLLLYAVDREDTAAAVDALTSLLGRPEQLSDRALEIAVGDLLLRSAGSADLFAALAATLTRHGFSVPPMVAAAFRAVGTLEGSLRLLDPTLDVVEAARAHVGGLGEHSVTDLRRALEAQAVAALPLVKRLPRRLDRITEDLEAGRISVAVRPWDELASPAALGRILGEVTQAIIAAVLALCGTALMISDGGPTLAGTIHVLGYVGALLFLFSFVLGARLLVRGFRERS